VEALPIKLDLHVHTHYSNDSLITPKELVYYARRRGLDGVAVTDHDRLDGALRIAKEVNLLVVPGIEVSSSKGHIVGLNIQEPIPSRLDVDETIDKIHKAGGIAVACHPVTLFKGSLGKNVTSEFDAIEVVNSSAFPFKYSVRHSKQLAFKTGIRSQVAGSDAHYGPEIGCAYTLLDADRAVDEAVDAIRRGLCQPFGKAIPLATRLKRELMLASRKSKLH
jgi:predicted metal-dependent phosphoesterase TrpH